jgi:hypothetical protein
MVWIKINFISFLHEITLNKWGHDDEFHWNQMLNNQGSNLENDELYELQLVVLDIEYMWLHGLN